MRRLIIGCVAFTCAATLTGCGDDRTPEAKVDAAIARLGAAATGALATVVEHFPQSVEMPPLRHHVEDVRHLVPFLIDRLTHGGPRCSPDAMRMLLRHRWPGNVAQLTDALRRIVAHRRTRTITLTDLPAEVQTAGRRTLTPLESIECDAIVAGLHAAGATAPRPPVNWACPGPPSTARSATTASSPHRPRADGPFTGPRGGLRRPEAA